MLGDKGHLGTFWGHVTFVGYLGTWGHPPIYRRCHVPSLCHLESPNISDTHLAKKININGRI